MADARVMWVGLWVVGGVGVVGLMVFGFLLRVWYRPVGLQVVMVEGQAVVDGVGERRYVMVGDVLPVGWSVGADRHVAVRLMDGEGARLEFIGRGRIQRRESNTCVLTGGTLLVQAHGEPWSCVVPWATVVVEGSAAVSVVDQQALVVVHDGAARIDAGGQRRSMVSETVFWVDEEGGGQLLPLRKAWDFAVADEPSPQLIGLIRSQHRSALSASDGGEWWVHGHADDVEWAVARWPVPSGMSVRSIAWRLRQMQCSDDGRWLIAIEDASGQHHRLGGGGFEAGGAAHIGYATWDGQPAVAVALGLEQGSAVLVLEQLLLLGSDDADDG